MVLPATEPWPVPCTTSASAGSEIMIQVLPGSLQVHSIERSEVTLRVLARPGPGPPNLITRVQCMHTGDWSCGDNTHGVRVFDELADKASSSYMIYTHVL